MTSSIDTICALSTPFGRAALGLIRVSGPKVPALIHEIAGGQLPPKTPVLKTIRSRTGAILDEAVLTYFEEPRSYTGEAMLEISCHGNPVIVEQILDDLVSRETRMAEPGEFTKRALANQKMSIDEVESLGMTLNADSPMAVRRALNSKLGGISERASKLRGLILDLLVEIQSQLDFSDTEVGVMAVSEIQQGLLSISRALNDWVEGYRESQANLKAWLVVLAGPPNSGKSSLFNAIIGKEKAIVFDEPGTTRDFLEHRLELNGRGVVIVDTAGIRSNPEPIERLGIQKSLEMMGSADLICWVADSDVPDLDLKSRFSGASWLNIHSKSDLGGVLSKKADLAVSAKTGAGLSELKSAISPPAILDLAEEEGGLTSQRQVDLVTRAAAGLLSAYEELGAGQSLDLVADKALRASEAVAEITGAIPNEAVLTEIFGRFCIGK